MRAVSPTCKDPTMNPALRPSRWLALALVAWLGIGCAGRVHAPVEPRVPDRAAACIDSDIVGDADPRRPC